MKAQPIASVPRVALTLEEAALALGVSQSHLRRHVLPDLRVIRSGSVRLVPVAELERWAERTATLAGGGTLAVQAKAPPHPRQRAGGMAQGAVTP